MALRYAAKLIKIIVGVKPYFCNVFMVILKADLIYDVSDPGEVASN